MISIYNWASVHLADRDHNQLGLDRNASLKNIVRLSDGSVMLALGIGGQVKFFQCYSVL